MYYLPRSICRTKNDELICDFFTLSLKEKTIRECTVNAMSKPPTMIFLHINIIRSMYIKSSANVSQQPRKEPHWSILYASRLWDIERTIYLLIYINYIFSYVYICAIKAYKNTESEQLSPEKLSIPFSFEDSIEKTFVQLRSTRVESFLAAIKLFPWNERAGARRNTSASSIW